MSNLKVSLTGQGEIDNAVIYLDDPSNTIAYQLNPVTGSKWESQTIKIPMSPGDPLSYNLYVVAFSGTRFKCTITDEESGRSLDFEGTTGIQIRSRAHISGSKMLR